MAKILVTGAMGQLGSAIKKIEKRYKSDSFIFTDINELDITKLPAVEKFFKNNKPDVVVNCAAYTAVDKAEEEGQLAKSINAIGPRNLAECCAKHKVFLIHISSDYVFDGKRNTPYHEQVSTNPIGAYGKSKFEGELEILLAHPIAAIIRTSWLYSVYGKNFVKTILDHAKSKPELKVVYDQVGCPTLADDLALVVMKMIERRSKITEVEVFHYANEGVCSWYDFSMEIVKQAKLSTKIVPVESSEYKQVAPRPSYSVFNKSKIKVFLDIDIPYWTVSLENCMKELI